jgi:hypothetical protein
MLMRRVLHCREEHDHARRRWLVSGGYNAAITRAASVYVRTCPGAPGRAGLPARPRPFTAAAPRSSLAGERDKRLSGLNRNAVTAWLLQVMSQSSGRYLEVILRSPGLTLPSPLVLSAVSWQSPRDHGKRFGKFAFSWLAKCPA